MIITRVRPMSFAKITGTLYVVLGLIFGSFISLAALVVGFPPDTSGEPGGFVRTLFGVGAVVILPILYGGLGFVSTLIAAWLYNVVAGLVGGVEIDVQ